MQDFASHTSEPHVGLILTQRLQCSSVFGYDMFSSLGLQYTAQKGFEPLGKFLASMGDGGLECDPL